MSSAGVLTCIPDSGRIFRETSLRPPVPGQETKNFKTEKFAMDPQHYEQQMKHKEDLVREAEGCAAQDSRFSRWGRSLNLLLDDQDGATLFRMYLEGQGLVDLLSFWFACNGFRAMDPAEPKTSKTAKAIYRWYVQNSQAVSGRLKPSTRAQVKDCVKNQQLNRTVFDQAQQEIQRAMEQEAFPSFLQSDICREYARAIEDSPTPDSPGPGLPTLAEEEEYNGLHHTSVGSSTMGKINRAFSRIPPRSQRSHLRKNEQVYRYFAPAASINDSEISSDALTEDSMSVTDSSVDGIPPYRSKQREIHRSVSANGQVPLPFVPRTMRPPAEMMPSNPAEFAAKLTIALEKVKRQRDAEEKLEEKLQRLKEEEDKPECDIPASSHDALPAASLEDDPQSILDDHVSRVLKTPSNLSPRSQSPFIQRKVKGQATFGKGQSFTSSHLRPKAPPGMETPVTQNIEQRGSTSLQGSRNCRKVEGSLPSNKQDDGNSSLVLTTPLSPEQEVERSHSVLQWVLESAKMMKKHHRDTNTSINHCLEVKKTSHRTTSQPAHLFLQDTSMPPLTAPNTLDQLEEARRRLVEDKRVPKLHKNRCVQSATLKEKGKAAENVPSSGFSTMKSDELKSAKKMNSDQGQGGLAIVYYFCGERIPYMIRTKEPSLTLQEFKDLLSKKGSYKYYFKKESQEFECNAVFQEISEEDALLPLYEEKIICKVERAC
ncbi:axin-related protein-like [Bufo gargarizans]|uniref:axin-related protein-like n=1 Tax=Bufo gargarizans TaxID=30331 RepID=UPI001CF3C990|nr:axin-related protein-like [Bufo gargarizans]